jgi:glutamate dehydrogenase/leucine dehydrogenase
MTWKAAVVNILLGAAKGGIQGDLRNLFLHELELMTCR